MGDLEDMDVFEGGITNGVGFLVGGNIYLFMRKMDFTFFCTFWQQCCSAIEKAYVHYLNIGIRENMQSFY